MKILLVSEGPHELGPDHSDGALDRLTRKMLRSDASFTAMKVSDPSVKTHRLRGKGGGTEKRVRMWIRRAQREGFDAIILVIDRDKEPDRIRQMELVQDDENVTFPRALGVAIVRFDAWMLADEQAIGKALGCQIDAQKAPESNRDPKSDLRSLQRQSEFDSGLPQLYALIAQHAKIDQLKHRCPKGFAPFAQRVEAL